MGFTWFYGLRGRLHRKAWFHLYIFIFCLDGVLSAGFLLVKVTGDDGVLS